MLPCRRIKILRGQMPSRNARKLDFILNCRYLHDIIPSDYFHFQINQYNQSCIGGISFNWTINFSPPLKETWRSCFYQEYIPAISPSPMGGALIEKQGRIWRMKKGRENGEKKEKTKKKRRGKGKRRKKRNRETEVCFSVYEYEAGKVESCWVYHIKTKGKSMLYLHPPLKTPPPPLPPAPLWPCLLLNMATLVYAGIWHGRS